MDCLNFFFQKKKNHDKLKLNFALRLYSIFDNFDNVLKFKYLLFIIFINFISLLFYLKFFKKLSYKKKKN